MASNRVYTCNCPVRCKRNTVVSRSTWFDHARFRAQSNIPTSFDQYQLAAQGTSSRVARSRQTSEEEEEPYRKRQKHTSVETQDGGGEGQGASDLDFGDGRGLRDLDNF